MKMKKEVLVCCLVLLLGTLFMTNTAQAALIWSQGFETLTNGDVNGQGTTWFADRDETYAYAHVDEDASVAFNGNKYLETHQQPYYSLDVDFGWYDDTASAPHGGQLELSFWMNRNSEAHWQMNNYAWNGETVFSLANAQVGSLSSIDALADGVWQETLAIVPTDIWRQVFIQMDFDQSTVQYRVRAGDGTWQGWYDSGVAATYFRYFRFTYGNDYDTTIYFDDFALATPEPATITMLGMGLFALRKRRK